MNLIKIKASLSKNFHISPHDIDKMTMWEYELFMKVLNDQIKEDNDAQQEEMDKHDIGKYKKMANQKQPSMNIPQMKMPKF